jgi:beta-glucosidase/6-phospho-beta-glucosidase/beta-galactosidase
MTANPYRLRIAWPRPAPGDRVTQWTTLNEPRWVALIGNPAARPAS